MKKVEGRPDLIKENGGVVNIDDAAFRQAKLAKKRILDERRRADELETRLNKVEELLTVLLKDKG